MDLDMIFLLHFQLNGNIFLFWDWERDMEVMGV